MPHFKVSDDSHSHPKVIMAGDAAWGFWNRAGCWCTAYGTDGFVPDWWVKQQPQGRIRAKRLVEVELWHPGEYQGDRPEYRGLKGYNFHEWRQDSYEKVEADREKWRQKKAAQRGASPPLSPGDKRRDTKGDSGGDSRESPGYIPTTQSNSGYVTDAATDSTERETGIAATPGADLVRRIIPTDHPAAVRTALRIRASELIRSGTPSEDVEAALRLWLTKPQLGPNALASLVSEVVKARAAPVIGANGSTPRRSTTDQRVADVQALKNRPPMRLEIES